MPESVSNSRSISALEMISGGDRAMMSPVVRISRPFSKASRKAVKARLVGAPGIDSSSMAPTRPQLRMSMTCGRSFSACRAVGPVVGQLGAAVEQALLLVGVEGGEAGGSRHRIAGIGVAVGELDEMLGAVHEGVVDLLLHEDRAHRDGAVGDALGGEHDIRRDAEIVDGEGRAEAAEAGDDLVEDQQDAVLVADLAQLLEIALGRDQHAGGAGDRLDDDRGDGRGVVQGDQALQLVGELGAVLGLAAREGVAGEVVGVAAGGRRR